VYQQTGVTFQHITSQLPNNTITDHRRLKLADIQIVDDALGTNYVWIPWDAYNLFEIYQGDLYLRAGARIGEVYDTTQRIVVSVADTDWRSQYIDGVYNLRISGSDLVPPTLTFVGASSVEYNTGATQNLDLPDFSLANPGGYENERLTLRFEFSGGALQLSNVEGSLTEEVTGTSTIVEITGFLSDLQTAVNDATFEYDGSSAPTLSVLLLDQSGHQSFTSTIHFSVIP
jgi:hypothetical protein